MNLFFLIVNNNTMKKILLFFLFFFNISHIYGIEDIEINNEYLIPKFDKSIKVYNYFTNSDKVNIKVKPSIDETIYGDGEYIIDENKIINISSNDSQYIIKIFKDYKKNNDKGYLEELIVEGYDLKFSKNKHNYYINIDKEEYLNIDYKLSNDNVHFSISGNGNFDKSDNIISIVVNDEKYTIHALKTLEVTRIEDNNKEKKSPKKEIVVLIISTISCIIIFVYFYSLFIFN